MPSQREAELHDVRTDLVELHRRAERLGLEVAASLIRMAILDVETTLRDDAVARRFDS